MLLSNANIVTDGLRELCAFLCSAIYRLMAFAYNLFFEIASFKILSSDGIKAIYQRVTLILAIIMVFYVTFEFVKYVVQPDAMTDKEKGAHRIIFKMVGVVLLIAFIPTIFSLAYDFEHTIITNGTISKIILGRKMTDPYYAGRQFSVQVLNTFYYYEGDEKTDCENGINCAGIVKLNKSTLINDGKLPYMGLGLNSKDDISDEDAGSVKTYKIHFDALFAVLVGGFITYMLILYCVDIAVRAIQLVYLQVIAPIPIIGFLSPKKDGIFQKWGKQCITTYLDIFIRLSLIYFILLICTILLENNAISNLGEAKLLVRIAIIMGLLLFAQKAPKMLQELFPKMGAASGNFGLKAGERVAPLAARAIGAGLGGARNLIGGGIRHAAWRNARNKANGWATGFARFTREGRENNRQKREEARQHKQEQQAARRRQREAVESTSNMKKFGAAQSAWNEKMANNEKIQDLKQRIRAASASGNMDEARRLGHELSMENAKMRQSKEYKNWDNARRTLANSDLGREMIKNTQNARLNYENARKARNAAQKAYDEAADGTPEKIAAKNALDAAKNNENAAQKSLLDAEKQYDERIETAKQDVTRAEEQVLDDRNKQNQGVGGFVFDTLGSTARGVATGAKATKFEEIGKKVNEAVKNDIAREKQVQQYYDNGGLGGVSGWADRTVQQFEKTIGAPTAYERTSMETKSYEPAIKQLEAKSGLTKDVKATADGAEDRLKDKINDLKLPAESGKIKTVDLDGNSVMVDVQPGENLGQVYRRYQGMEAKADEEAKSAASRLDKFRADHPSAEIPEGYTGPLSAEQQQLRDLEQEASEKSRQAANAKYATTLVHKNAARYEFSAILNDFANGKSLEEIRNNDLYEGVAVEKVYDALKSLDVARSNPDVVNEVRSNLLSVEKPECFEAFMSGNITDFDTLDAIKTAAIQAGNKYDREAKAKKEEKRSIETSNQTSAQKAAQDFNPNGGGK